jgi:excisionase family DNA binding protein
MRVGTAKDAATLLRVSDDQVYRLVARGEIPTLRRIGGQLRFDMDRLEQWLQETEAEAPS